MVNSELVLKLMELYSAHPESFPRILSAFVRHETLRLIDVASSTVEAITDEDNKAGRGRYLGEHLEGLTEEIADVEAFLSYFRDVPLVLTTENEVITSEDIRLELKEYVKWLRSIREQARRDNWRNVEDDEFNKVKEQTHYAACDAETQLRELDAALALGWIEPESESEPESEPDHGSE